MEKGYAGWSRAIVIALSAKNKVVFIDGTSSEPDSNSPQYKAWSRCNDMCNGAQLYQLQKELSDATQGASDIAGCFTKIKKISDELDALNTADHCTCKSSCGGKAKTIKSLQDGRLIQFLMGLNEAYLGVKSNILMMGPLPTVSHDYSLLMQDEKQRHVHVASHLSDAAFMVSNQKFNTAQRLIGFTSDFKFTKSKRMQADAQSNVFTVGSDANNMQPIQDQGSLSNGNVITQEEFTQLFQLLQEVKVGQQSEQTSYDNVSSNCAGIITPFLNPNSFSLFSHTTSNFWILDSGASEHMTYDKSLLFDIKPLRRAAPSMKRVVVLGEVQHGLYLLKSAPVKSSSVSVIPSLISTKNLVSSSVCNSTTSPVVSLSQPSVSKLSSDVSLWHQRLGHLPFTDSPILSTSSSSHPQSSPSPSPISSPLTPVPFPVSTPVSSPSISPSITPAPILRHFTRVSNPPSYLADYICNSIYLTNLIASCFAASPCTTVLPFSALTKSNQILLKSISHIPKPVTILASLHPCSREAMAKASEALEANQTWDVVELPRDKKGSTI
uniref:Retrotransposon Copia-like N-terminal domain-containing protein n=1 Tax=Nicotiana tabacum TaxID=4097 RepID=A0A1S4A495_TOBAC|nr:PREDICTED: uncharacterized protein LOC107793615 [Nicotiana tabacum]